MASSSKSKTIYDVFLSFRGTDLRNNFVSHLYQALHRNGIYTFRDSEELKKGDQILMLMKAIEESCIAVIVFSDDYTSSTWCLKELSKIMECKEQKGLTVLPVFYKVDPKEVRGGRESYRRALAKHESKSEKDSKKVKRWKKALFDAGNLSGWHLNDGDESELIQRIVTEISTHLDQKPLHVAKHLVGLASRVVKLKSMLNLQSNDDVLMVGLWGKGGIGKTTLFKAVYNDIFRQFGNSCFLANVREASKDCKDLVTLQEKLLSEILSLKEGLVVSSVDRGINLVQDRLRHKKVLLILDDVDDLRQLYALAGEQKWFGNGSRIIVTTRNKHLLTSHGIDLDHVYEVKELDDGAACELLRKHSFLTQQKLKIRTDLMDSVLHHAKDLPLALEVLGSFLRGRTEHAWESMLNKLSRIPDKTINDVLKISYDGLEENEREVFLHIACFFKGWDSEYTKKVLDSCDFEVAIGLEILIEMSLISIEHNILQVHDLIQLMGTDIVNQECRDDPGKRSRLWLYEDVLGVLSCDMGDCAVKAIVLEQSKPTEMCIHPDAFTKMRRLRLLILRNVHDPFQDPIYLPNALRWFEWPGCARQISEFSSGPKKLVGLHMSKLPNRLEVSIYLYRPSCFYFICMCICLSYLLVV
ncbi:disease resistance protein RUN1 [Eucalyptus grandis]|uniref:disease resistance protein RUN1 n=1 Tax=Eucalyptus grandis TaxID=71139 RepID=UPI00192EC7B6|nr:disease resistance protein RUN1 [Eucalyptus grandis]